MPAKSTKSPVAATPVRRGKPKAAEPIEEVELEEYEEVDEEEATSAPTISFVDALPKFKRGGGRGRTSRWLSVVETLKENEGRWALLGTFNSQANRPKPLVDAGIKIAMRSTGELNDEGKPTWNMYGCFNPVEDEDEG